MQTWPVSNPPRAAAALFPPQLQFPVLLGTAMFCCFFSPFLTSEVLDEHLLLQFILESCTWIWELGYVSVLVACGFLSELCRGSDFGNSWLKSEVSGFHCAPLTPSC